MLNEMSNFAIDYYSKVEVTSNATIDMKTLVTHTYDCRSQKLVYISERFWNIPSRHLFDICTETVDSWIKYRK